ncbi:DUF4175 domain-containing protein, partial [Methylobacterium organophilum]|nr:DUF4175 domain-containing protein [Methylobacterium organophilum]
GLPRRDDVLTHAGLPRCCEKPRREARSEFPAARTRLDLTTGRVRVPTADESAVQRARRIMEELRRKLGDPSRPREELDYFERLLRRN